MSPLSQILGQQEADEVLNEGLTLLDLGLQMNNSCLLLLQDLRNVLKF